MFKIFYELFMLKVFATIFHISFTGLLSALLTLIIMLPIIGILYLIWPPAILIALAAGIVGGIASSSKGGKK